MSEGNGIPAGYTAKDFTVLQHDGVFHAFYILSNLALRSGGNLAMHQNERRFGHAVSTDLATWTFVDSSFSVGSGFDRHHVWAPALLWADGRYWMFFTGVEDTLVSGAWLPHRMKIGLAWTNDFNYWGRGSGPIFACGAPFSPWANCSEGGVRDPFVFRADTSASGSGWFLYFVAQPNQAPSGYYDPKAFLVGTASGHEGDMTYWTDFGPNWSTYRTYQNQANQTTNKVESPHLFKHRGIWYLFFTGDYGLAYLSGSTPVGDTPLPQGEWTYLGTFPEVWSTEFASETFRATWADGSTEEYFATVQAIGGYENQIAFRILNPAPSGPLLADPLYPSELIPFTGAVEDGDTLRLWFRAALGTQVGTHDQLLTRPAPIEVWEADDAAGVRTWSRLNPESVGIPSVFRVTTRFNSGDTGDTIALVPRWVLDDDATPDRLELQIRCRGKDSPLFAVARSGTAVVGVPDRAPAGLALRASPAPGGEAALHVEVPERLHARLDLYDVRGRRLRTLIDRVLEPGATTLVWDRRDEAGVPVGSGVTFAQLRAGGSSVSVRVLTLR